MTSIPATASGSTAARGRSGPGRAIIVIVSAMLAACRSGPAGDGHAVPGGVVRPPLTNAEYEMAQLRSLGAVGDGGSPTFAPASVRTAPDLVPGETTRLIMPATQPKTRSAAAGTGSAPVVVRPSPARSGPVQKVGSSYLGPGGVTSRRVGSIMLNSDGTTGQLIGNTIINH